MINMLRKWQISSYTYFYFLVAFLCGYFRQTITIFIIIIVHELGHLFWIRYFAYEVVKVKIYPFGGLTTINKPINSPLWDDVLISLGGVMAQLILFLIWPFSRFYNLAIMFFNLLPIYPLDGYRLLETLLGYKYPYVKTLKYATIISFVSMILFLFKQSYNLIGPFLIVEFILLIKSKHYLQEKFFLERYLYNFPYHKIESHQLINKNLLKRNTLHFFWYQQNYLHEKKVLKNYYNN